MPSSGGSNRGSSGSRFGPNYFGDEVVLRWKPSPRGQHLSGTSAELYRRFGLVPDQTVNPILVGRVRGPKHPRTAPSRAAWQAYAWLLEQRHPADWSRRTELVLPDEQAAVDPLVGVHDELRLARLARQKQQGKSV